jgi:hypothetical protein
MEPGAAFTAPGICKLKRYRGNAAARQQLLYV